MNKSRSINVAKNIYFSILCQVLNLIINFILRTIFIKKLNMDYLGINGLFTNILMILSFAELGIGNAIVFSMYKPLAINDVEKIKSLMYIYKKAYHAIGGLVFIFGISIMPFMENIIKVKPDIVENINYIYVLFLVNSVISYFFTYKRSIIIADQKNYIVSIYVQIIQTLKIITQLVCLTISGKYILFLYIQIIFTFLENIIVSKKADKLYPYLKSKKIKPLDKKERTSIYENVKSLFLYKFGSVILNGTDNIIISGLLGVKWVGLSSNYMLIINSLNGILGQVLSSFTASIGNLNATESSEKTEHVFNKMFFIVAWVYGFASIGLLIFINPLIEIWIGKSFILPQYVVLTMVIHFYINGVQFVVYSYRTTMGLFVQGRVAPVLAAVINIILSIVLSNKYGLAGIFIATSIARFLTMGIIDPILVYKIKFKKSVKEYFTKYFEYVILFIFIYLMLEIILSFIQITNIINLILSAFVMTILFNTFMILVFYKNKYFKEIKSTLLGLIKK